MIEKSDEQPTASRKELLAALHMRILRGIDATGNDCRIHFKNEADGVIYAVICLSNSNFWTTKKSSSEEEEVGAGSASGGGCDSEDALLSIEVSHFWVKVEYGSSTVAKGVLRWLIAEAKKKV